MSAAYNEHFRLLRRPNLPRMEPGSRRGRFSFALGENVRDMVMIDEGTVTMQKTPSPLRPLFLPKRSSSDLLPDTINIILTPEVTSAGAGAPEGVSRKVILEAALQAGRKRGDRKGAVRETRVTRSVARAAREAAGKRRVMVMIDDPPFDRSEYIDMTWM